MCMQQVKHSCAITNPGKKKAAGMVSFFKTYLFIYCSSPSPAFIGLDECYKEETRCETGMT